MYVACIHCYAGIHLECDSHACRNLSTDDVKDEVLETLAFFNIYETLYNIFVEMHPDQDIPVEHLIRTYIDMIANNDTLQAIYDVMWTKGFEPGAALLVMEQD